MEEDCVNETIPFSSNASGYSHAEMLNQVINGIALPAVCAFGIVGNILNLTILTRRKLQKSFRTLEQSANLCLIALAVSDLMFCVLALLTTFIPSDSIYDDQGIVFFYGLYSYFFINVFIMESTMLTVAMSLERYLAICFPLRQDLYLTTRRIKYVIVSTFIFSLVFNIPVIWRFEAKLLCSPTVFWPQDKNATNLSPMPGLQADMPGHLMGSDKSNEGGKVNIALPSFLSSTLPFPSSSSFKLSSSSLSTSSPLSTTPATAAAAESESKLGAPNLSLTKTLINLFHNDSQQRSMTASNITSSSYTPPPSPMAPNRFPVRYKIQETIGKETEKMAYRIAWAIVGNVIPLILLFIFNVCLCRKIYLSYKMRRQFKRQSRAKNSSHILTLTLVVIVVMFFILVAPSELLLLVSNTSTTVEPILNFMQSLNFSVNFILYCIISPTFRKTLKYICMCGCYNIYQVSRDWKKEFETSLM